jgi:glutaconate CoA-transferase subunit A
MTTRSKLVSLSEALDDVRDGMQIATGGWIFDSQPVALVRELIRRRVRNLHLIPSPGSIAPDLLIGAGCVRRLSCVFLSFEQFGLAPQFRRAVEAGRLEVLEMDGPALAGGLRAGACDLPYMLIPDLGTDLPKVNPSTYQRVATSPGERPLFKVPAIQPDIVLLHAQRGDELGNIQFDGAPFFDPFLAQAGKRVIVSVDETVSTDEIRRTNHLTKIPAAFVSAVVELPHGAHPTASASNYDIDPGHLAEYVTACRDSETFERYLELFVFEATAHREYLERCHIEDQPQPRSNRNLRL